MQKYIE